MGKKCRHAIGLSGLDDGRNALRNLAGGGVECAGPAGHQLGQAGVLSGPERLSPGRDDHPRCWVDRQYGASPLDVTGLRKVFRRVEPLFRARLIVGQDLEAPLQLAQAAAPIPECADFEGHFRPRRLIGVATAIFTRIETELIGAQDYDERSVGRFVDASNTNESAVLASGPADNPRQSLVVFQAIEKRRHRGFSLLDDRLKGRSCSAGWAARPDIRLSIDPVEVADEGSDALRLVGDG